MLAPHAQLNLSGLIIIIIFYTHVGLNYRYPRYNYSSVNAFWLLISMII